MKGFVFPRRLGGFSLVCLAAAVGAVACAPATGPAPTRFAQCARPAGDDWDEEPTIVDRGTPTYPPAAASRGIEGWAAVTVTVSSSEKVLRAAIAASEPAAIFDAAALEAALSTTFRPAKRNGLPVPSIADLKYTFTPASGRAKR